MFECFRCMHKAAIWQNDFDAEDFGHEGAGIVSVLECSACGSTITVTTLEEEELS